MRKTPAIAVLALSSALVLAACGSDDDDGATDSTSPSTDVPTDAPTVETDSGLEITGEAGGKPAVVVPEQDAPTDLVVDVVEEGEGAEVEKGDWLVTNYLGQTWDERDGEVNVFDNSYDRGSPAGFNIGKGEVIKGWDNGLVGQKIGSRVALTIPADQAYAGLEHDLAEDTLVFVVDILDTADASATAEGTDVEDLPEGFPAVTSKKNGQPEIDLSEATAPEKSSAEVVVEGDGDEIGDGIVANLVMASYPNGEAVQNTWKDGSPIVIPSDAYANVKGLAEVLDGAKVGTRVVAQVSGEDNPNAEGEPGEALVYVVDVVGTYSTPSA